MHWLLGVSLSSLKEGALFNGMTIAVSAIATYLLRLRFFDTMGLILLLEAVALWLAGGAMELGATASSRRLVSILQRKPMDWTKKGHAAVQMRAAVFAMTGAFLFLESMIMAAAVMA